MVTTRISKVKRTKSCSESVNKQRRSLSKSKNILTFLTRSKSYDERLYNLSIGELKILISCFPDFPQNMLIYLIQKHNGNCFEVYQYLIQNGWNSIGNNKYKLLPNINAQQFITSYYHGEKSGKIEELLSKAKNGSYLTYYKYANKQMYYYAYYISYKDNLGNIIHEQIDSPEVTPSIINKLNLQTPIHSSILRRISYVPGAIEILEHLKTLQ